MTPGEIRDAHHRLGLSSEKAAKFLQVGSARTVRRWWSGENTIPGPVEVLTKALIESKLVRRHFGLTLIDETPDLEYSVVALLRLGRIGALTLRADNREDAEKEAYCGKFDDVRRIEEINTETKVVLAEHRLPDPQRPALDGWVEFITGK